MLFASCFFSNNPTLQASDFFGELKENSKAAMNVAFPNIRASSGFQNRDGVHLPASRYFWFLHQEEQINASDTILSLRINRMFVGSEQIGGNLMLDCLSKDGTNPGKHSSESTV